MFNTCIAFWDVCGVYEGRAEDGGKEGGVVRVQRSLRAQIMLYSTARNSVCVHELCGIALWCAPDYPLQVCAGGS